MKSLSQYIKESSANNGVRLEFVSNQTGKDTYLDVLSLLDEKEHKLWENGELKFKIWKESNRERDDFHFCGGRYTDPEKVASLFDKAVSYGYDGCRRRNPRYAGLRKIDCNKIDPYISVFDDLLHVILFSVEVYNCHGDYVRVTLEAIYDKSDYDRAYKKKYHPEKLNLNPGDLVAYEIDGDVDYTEMFIVSRTDPKGYLGYTVIRDESFVPLCRGRNYNIQGMPGLKTVGFYGTNVIGPDGNLYNLKMYSAPRYTYENLFKNVDNLRVNNIKDISVYKSCVHKWLESFENAEEKYKKMHNSETLSALKKQCEKTLKYLYTLNQDV